MRRSGPAIEDRNDCERSGHGLVGEPVGRGDRPQKRRHPFRTAQSVDHAHRDLARKAIIDTDGRGDRIGNGCEQYTAGNGANRPPERQAGHHCHAADQHRAWIERKPENYRKDIVPANRLQLGRYRLDAELLDAFGLTISLADLFFDFYDRMHLVLLTIRAMVWEDQGKNRATIIVLENYAFRTLFNE